MTSPPAPGSIPATTAPGGSAANYGQGHARANSAFVVGSSGTPGTQSSSFTLNEYFTFTLTPSPGYTLDLETLNFTTSYYSLADSDVIANFFVRTSLDGFATTVGSVISQTMEDTSAVFNAREIDLSAPLFQGVDEAVIFRIYLFDNNATNQRWIAIDNVSLEGISTIPEPSSTILASIALAAALNIRRR